MEFTRALHPQKQAYDWIGNSEKLYRTLQSAYPDGIVIMDLDGHIIDTSDITKDIFKVTSKKDIIGTQFLKYVHDSEIERIKKIFTMVQTEGIVKNVEIVLVRENHLSFICDMSITLIQDFDGTVKAYLIVFRDITQQKKIETQLIHKARMISLGQMATAMAHEINQPLISISLSVENLQNKVLNYVPKAGQYLQVKIEKIQEDVLRIGRIIDHIRAFSQDYDDMLYSSFNINEIIRNALSMMSQQLIANRINLIQAYDQDTLPVYGNPYRFEQVVVNLLANSKKAIEEKSLAIKSRLQRSITIRTYHDVINNYVLLSDNGIGIKPQDIEKIMLPFYTTHKSEKGSGLGLPIVFMILREFKGTLSIESQPLIGTTIKITIPNKDEFHHAQH
jgi:PAS domain S-box-containing protein